MKPTRCFFLLLLCLSLTQVGCSVASVGQHPAAGPTEPVIVSEPIPVIPEPLDPSNPSLVEPISQMEPIVVSELPPDSIIQESPTNPPLVVVGGTPITHVDFEPPTTEPGVDEQDQSPTQQEPVTTPQEIIDAVNSIDIQSPPDLVDESREPAGESEFSEVEVEPETPDVGQVDRDEEDEVDFVVQGKCHGKKKATVLYHRKGHAKKGLTAVCVQDNFKIKIRQRKKDLKHLKIQTLL